MGNLNYLRVKAAFKQYSCYRTKGGFFEECIKNIDGMSAFRINYSKNEICICDGISGSHEKQIDVKNFERSRALKKSLDIAVKNRNKEY